MAPGKITASSVAAPSKPATPDVVPGTIRLSRLPDGTAIARVEEISQWLTVKQAAKIACIGDDLIRGKCEDGTLSHRWKNHGGPGGTILIDAASFHKWLKSLCNVVQ